MIYRCCTILVPDIEKSFCKCPIGILQPCLLRVHASLDSKKWFEYHWNLYVHSFGKISPAQRSAWTQSGWSLWQAMCSGVWPSSLHWLRRVRGSSVVTSWLDQEKREMLSHYLHLSLLCKDIKRKLR